MSQQPVSDTQDARDTRDTRDTQEARHAGGPEATGQEQAGEPRPEEECDRPQDAWTARLELYKHAPTSFGGGLAGRDQTGVSGGQVTGDVVMGTKIEHHYRFGAAAHVSGEIPWAELEDLTRVFTSDEEHLHNALVRLRGERVLVLSGAPFTGRRSAALMLLHALGATPVRALDPKTRPKDLKDELGGGSRGFLVCDLVTDRNNPLRDIDLWAVREKLAKDAYLVVTVDLQAFLSGVDAVEWRPPAPEAVLRSHLHARIDDPERERELLDLAPARDFLAGNHHQLREAAAFAEALTAHAAGRSSVAELGGFGLTTVRRQVHEWFDDAETPLRDKAFLISLAAFDEAPYALTAELSDDLFAQFQTIEDAGLEPRIPVFGTSIAKRLRLARATGYHEEEYTEWGPVQQRKARFQERRTAVELLRELWTGHPSARPALVRWLRRLADDGRPLVRTRAAVTAAVLADADLPSAMALLIEGWANAKRYRFCLVAANALALAHAVGTANIPGILRTWCAQEQPQQRLRWTAIRAYALVGADMPEEALAALADAARAERDDEEAEQIAQSVALLLTVPSPEARGQVLAGLVELLQDKPPVRRLALRAFVLACDHTDDLQLLHWYAEAAALGGVEDDRHLAALWRTALGDLRHTGDALKALRRWVHQAGDDPQAEQALTVLLPALAVTAEDRKRLSHLLRTLRGEHCGEPPAVAGRLLASL